MAHGRDKPKREKRRPKKDKTAHPAATREQQIISHVAGQDQHRPASDESRSESS